MKSGLFLSATASLMMLGSTAVFAQSYAAPGAVTMKPGQIQSAEQSAQASSYSSQPDLGSVQAGATSLGNGYQTLKPGQAG